MPNILKGWIEVDEIFCKGCEICIEACPMRVLILDVDILNSKGYHPVKLLTNGCTGCAICAVVCPEAAITVYREKQPKEKDQTALSKNKLEAGVHAGDLFKKEEQA